MAGDSAQRKYGELRDERRRRLRTSRPALVAIAVVASIAGAMAMDAMLDLWWLGALLGLIPVINLLLPDQQEVAWRTGAEGERVVGRALDALAPTSHALHDRRMPRSRANIDHILVTPTGVWTIDAKNYKGKIETRSRGTELWINGRNRSKLIEQAMGQATAVRQVLAAQNLAEVPVQPALCFVGGEWPLLFRPTSASGVALVSPRRAARLTSTDQQTLSSAQVAHIASVLHRALPPVIEPPPGTNSPETPSPETPLPPHALGAAGPTPSPTLASASSFFATPSEVPPSSPSASEVSVVAWNRYGKRRLYVNDGGGVTLGYVDLESNRVVPVSERHRAVVAQAVAAHLRGS